MNSMNLRFIELLVRQQRVALGEHVARAQDDALAEGLSVDSVCADFSE